ncbi:ComEC/Rec2 family competence protein [Treponema primitia]|uniref:ComEC/Rec2 family competence protein n=1 Tax=Treponema primitia TaxID=88058 RepID=UPI000255507E|nr:ComEC/Rec2 family competence protein [Treponema primitia]
MPGIRDPFRARFILGLSIFLIALVSLSRVLAQAGIQRRLLALSAGLILGIAAAASLEGPPQLGLPGEAVRGISGVMGEDPRESSGGQGARRAAGMGYLELRGVTGAGGLRATARGRVLVFFPPEALPRLREFGRGAEVLVEGAFAGGTGGFNGASPMFRAKAVHIVGPAPAWEQLRTGIRLAILDKLKPHIWGGLGAALLLGVKDNLDSELAKKYQFAGCSHVLALSGMHLAIVAAITAFFLRKPLGLKLSSITGAAFILLYVALIGAQPSLERAAIMYLLGAAVVLGFLPRQPRTSGPISLLAMAFLIQIVLRPSSGTSLSFILSYLALAGILTVGEFFHGILRGRLPELLASPLAASLGAYLATAAVVAAGFGIIRPVGLLAGLVIVPLTTVFMVGAMAALALSFISPFLTGIAGMGLTLFYSLLDHTVTLAARVPGLAANGWGRELFLSFLVVVLCIFPGRPYSIRRQSLAPFN